MKNNKVLPKCTIIGHGGAQAKNWITNKFNTMSATAVISNGTYPSLCMVIRSVY